MADEKPLYVADDAAKIAGEADFKPIPSWPKTIGIISIVLGALGLLCGVVGVGMSLFGASMMGAQAGEFPPIYANPPMGMMIMTVLGTLWSIVLIVAGAVTASRKPVGRPMHLVWAAVAMIFGGVGIYNQMQVQAEVAKWVRENPEKPFSKQQAQGGSMGATIGYACGGFFGFAWPLFTLAWFGAVKRDSRQIAQGIEETAA